MIWWDGMRRGVRGFSFHDYAINQARLCIRAQKTWHFWEDFAALWTWGGGSHARERHANRTNETRCTRSGPGSISPESAWWCCCCAVMLFSLIAGEKPHLGSQPDQIIHTIMQCCLVLHLLWYHQCAVWLWSLWQPYDQAEMSCFF